MRVSLSAESCLDEGSFLKIASILNMVDDGWHIWEVQDPEELQDSLFLNQNPILKEMHEQAAKRCAYPSSGVVHRKRVNVVLNPENENEMTPDVADNFLKQPLTVLMENRFSDWTFLEAVLDVLAPHELKALLALTPPPMTKDSPGGNGQLDKVINEKVNEAKDRCYPIRLVVFTDSDARFPGDQQKKPPKIEQICKDHDIPFVLLEKRAIENYIPDSAFDAWCSHGDENTKTAVKALKDLSRIQRDHFPLKKGFCALGNAAVPNEEKELYAGVSDDDRTLLDKRLMLEPIDLLKNERESITPEALRERDWNGDLDRIVDMIAENL